MINLVSRFDSLEIDLKLHISNEDAEYCDRLTQDLKMFHKHQLVVLEKLAEVKPAAGWRVSHECR